MKGGKLTCRRKDFYVNENGFNCIKMSCVDYKNPSLVVKKYKCNYWKEYWDEEAQAKYWYNHLTGKATWIEPNASLNHIHINDPVNNDPVNNDSVNNAGKVFVPRRQHRLYFQKTRKNKKKQEKQEKTRKTRKNKNIGK